MAFPELGQEKKHTFRGRNELRTRVPLREIMEKKSKNSAPLNHFELGMGWRQL